MSELSTAEQYDVPPPGSPGPKNPFADGFGAFFAGIKFLMRHTQLIPYVLLPFILTVFAFLVLSIGSIFYAPDLKEWLFPDWEGWGWTVAAYTVVALVLVIIWIFGLVTVGSLIASPFNDYLSQRVEMILLPEQGQPPGGVKRLLVDLGQTLKQETLRLIIYIALFAACLPLWIIPLAGPTAFAVIMGFVNVRYLAWSGLDYCMARRQWGFRQKMQFLKQHRVRTMGYGVASLVFLSIPFTMLFVLPILAVGGSVLFCRIERETGG